MRRPKPEKPQRRGAAFVAVRSDGAILLRTRPDKGLLGGMTEVPTTAWTDAPDGSTTVAGAPFAANWRRAGSISHVFTHFALDLEVFRADGRRDIAAPDGIAGRRTAEILGEALPTVMKKVIEAAIPGATESRARPHEREQHD